ncbi:MAG: hypothetical protein OEZ39_15850 [Gammaproteobacteria bacterium]|nr:hypothetical protein [Gammaproteobacteria bacterium]MDH5653331.1 hypothetical protein [Gammaproteobacteria bacterium]
MRSRLRSFPVYETRITSIDSKYYNPVRLALSRLANPLRIKLPSLHTLDVLLDNETWIVVDRSTGDKPMLAWLDFDYASRLSLHKPIICRINHYHTQSAIIVDKVLELLRSTLRSKLQQSRHTTSNRIIYL